jgi:hypothetical protein
MARQTPLRLFLGAVLIAASTGSIFANDTSASFSFSAGAVGEPLSTVSADGSGILRFPQTAIGATSTVNLLVRSSAGAEYRLTSTAISDPAFRLVQPDASIPPGGFAIIPVTFTPSRRGLNGAFLGFSLVNGSGSRFSFFFSLSGNAVAADTILSFIAPPELNQIAVADGGEAVMPPAVTTFATSATFVISNLGDAATAVSSIALVGEAFTLTNLPLLPRTLPANSEIRFGVQFKPLATRAHQAILSVVTSNGSFRVTLRGDGVASALSYEVVDGPSAGEFQPGGSVELPAAPVGEAATLTRIRVRNRGGADSIVTTIAISPVNSSPTDFTLIGLPILPATLLPGAETEFQIRFTPAASGPRVAQLRIGDQLFTLTATGLGGNLTFFADHGNGPQRVESSITFPNTEVGGKRTVMLILRNSGNEPAAVSAISVTSGAGIFSIPQLPGLPMTIDSGAEVALPIVFAPLELGSASTSIQIDGRLLTIGGAGTQPPPLPPLRITGVTPDLRHLDQPFLGVMLDEPYPYDISGQLIVDFSPEYFVDDPSIRFPQGRTVDFMIRANETAASFGVWGNEIPFQTGTSAGRVRFRASASVGRVNMTGENPVTETAVLPVTAPEVRTLRATLLRPDSSRLPAQLTLVVTGYTPTRSLRKLTLEFAPAPGASISSPKLDVDVDAAFAAWFGSNESIATGTQFSVTLTITLSGDPNAIQSVSVRATNDAGESAPRGIDVPR